MATYDNTAAKRSHERSMGSRGRQPRRCGEWGAGLDVDAD